MWRQIRQIVTWPVAWLAARGKGCFCPVCERPLRRFLPFGSPVRPAARCVYCGSLERHRLLWLFLKERTDLLTGGPRQVLHIAPERCLSRRLRPLWGAAYLTADLSDPRVDRQLDVTAIPFSDSTFDLLLCSHVLEHVADDRRALSEFHRVLRAGGFAILQVPLSGDKTIENPALTDPQERQRLFGQSDHVRLCGRDYVDRICEAGFRVEVVDPPQLVPDRERRGQLGLSPAAGELFFCIREADDGIRPSA